MGLAWRAQGARRRRCGAIVDDEQRSDRRAIPMRPLRVPGGAGASAALALLDDGTASPASRRLASAPAAPGTRPLLILGQAPESSNPPGFCIVFGTSYLSGGDLRSIVLFISL